MPATPELSAGNRSQCIAAPQPAVRVAVLSTIGEAAAMLIARPLRFARRAILPLLIGTAAVLLQPVLGPACAAALAALRLTEVPFLLLILPLERVDWIASTLCLQYFVLRWHQVALGLDAASGPAPAFWPAYLRFALYVLVIFLLGYGGLLAGVFLPAAIDVYVAPGTMQRRFLYLPLWMHVFNVVTLAFLVLAGLVTRCGLLLPAAAAGRPMSVRAAWRSLKGNAWRLRAVLLVLSALLGALKWTIAKVPKLALPDWTATVLAAFTRELELYVVAALAASALAIFYRRIVGNRTAP